MAVFPDRIVLKNSTDPSAAIATEIGAGGASEITQGELVLGLAQYDVALFAKDETGNIVTLSGEYNSDTIVAATAPTTRLNGDPLRTGDTWLPSSAVLQVYDGAAWVETASGGSETLAGLVDTEIPLTATLLLHCDGTPGDQILVDSSVNNYAFTFTDSSPGANTPSALSDDPVKFGSTSMAFFGDSDQQYRLSTADSVAATSFGDQDFTVEFWYYTTYGGANCVMVFGDSFSNTGWAINVIGGDRVDFYAYDSSANLTLLQTPTGLDVSNQWAHIAVTRQGGALRLFVDGTLRAETDLGVGFTFRGIVEHFRLGAGQGTPGFNGSLDELRIVKGTAAYTQDFTVPSSPYSASTEDGDVLTWDAAIQKWVPTAGGGGGGAVDSVNGQTGTVSLGIQDMDDFSLNPSGGLSFSDTVRTGTWTKWMDAHSDPPGFVFPVNQSEWRAYAEPGIGVGTLQLASLDDDGDSCEDWVSVDGTDLKLLLTIDNTTYGPIPVQAVSDVASYGVYVQWNLSDFDPSLYDWGYEPGNPEASPTDPRPIKPVLVSLGYTLDSADTPLAEGDILQWDAADEKFKPAQLPTGGGGGAVDSVNDQTGVVSLGIQDMDDYGLVTASGVYVWDGVAKSTLSSTQNGEFTNEGYRTSYEGYTFYLGKEDRNGDSTVGDWINANMSADNDPSASVDFLLKCEGLSIDVVISCYLVAAYSGSYMLRAKRAVGVNPDEQDWLGIWSSSGDNYFAGFDVEMYPTVVASAVPLADGDILQWSEGAQRFQPAQLSTGGGAVDSVNGETGVVSLGIEDMNDYEGDKTGLLMDFDGGDGSTTFVESTGKISSWTAFNSAQQTDSPVKYGVSSFEGSAGLARRIQSNDLIGTAAETELSVGTGDFTLEFWLYLQTGTTSSFQTVFAIESDDGSDELMIMTVRKEGASGNVDALIFNYGTGSGVIPPVINLQNQDLYSYDTWAHVAVCRASGTLRAYVDGAEVASVSDSIDIGSLMPATLRWNIGYGIGNDIEYFDGRLDNMYFTPTAKYTSAFTPGQAVALPLDPADGQVLAWVAANSQWEPGDFISKATLKAEVAASADFADFQSRIAAL